MRGSENGEDNQDISSSETACQELIAFTYYPIIWKGGIIIFLFLSTPIIQLKNPQNRKRQLMAMDTRHLLNLSNDQLQIWWKAYHL